MPAAHEQPEERHHSLETVGRRDCVNDVARVECRIRDVAPGLVEHHRRMSTPVTSHPPSTSCRAVGTPVPQPRSITWGAWPQPFEELLDRPYLALFVREDLVVAGFRSHRSRPPVPAVGRPSPRSSWIRPSGDFARHGAKPPDPAHLGDPFDLMQLANLMVTSGQLVAAKDLAQSSQLRAQGVGCYLVQIQRRVDHTQYRPLDAEEQSRIRRPRNNAKVIAHPLRDLGFGNGPTAGWG
jgi:hypothetical protein